MRPYFGTILMLSLFFNSCQNHNLANIKLRADTVVSLNSLRIKNHLNLDTLSSPAIMETSTILITDSMLNTKQYEILIHDAKYDSINFMNCVNGESYIPIKFFVVENNVLKVSIYYSTQSGWYYEGEISTYEHNKIVLRQGKHRVIGGAARPMFSELTFKIFIPKQFNLGEIKYECPVL